MVLSPGRTWVRPQKEGKTSMNTRFKLMIASVILVSVLAGAAPAAVQMQIPGQDDSVDRACYNSAGQIVPCKSIKPKT